MPVELGDLIEKPPVFDIVVNNLSGIAEVDAAHDQVEADVLMQFGRPSSEESPTNSSALLQASGFPEPCHRPMGSGKDR